MKFRLLTFASGFALAASLGSLCATPANAQPRAALVVNIDERGRIPYVSHRHSDGLIVTTFDPVPTGKRLVVQHVSGRVTLASTTPGGYMTLNEMCLYRSTEWPESTTAPTAYLYARTMGDPTLFTVNEPAFLYVEAGQSPALRIIWGGVGGYIERSDITVSGYLVDLSQ